MCSVYTRRWRPISPDVVDVEPGFRVVHIDAGPYDVAKDHLPELVDEFTEGVLAELRRAGDIDAIHANYWLSGVAGHRLKHELDVPLVSTFHTLARVKAETGDPEPERRIQAEHDVMDCSDAITASCAAEAEQLVTLYGAPRRSHPTRAARRDPRVLLARRSLRRTQRARFRTRRFTDAALRRSHPAAQRTRRRHRRVGRVAPRATRSSSWSAARAAPTARPRPRRPMLLADELGVADRIRWVDAAAAPSCSPPTTARPMCASCRAGPSRSGSWRSRRPRAAPRSSLRQSADFVRSSTTARRAISSRTANPMCSQAPSTRCLRDDRTAARHGRARRDRARGYTWSTTAARLATAVRRPHRAPTGRLHRCVSDRAFTEPELDELAQRIDAWVDRQRLENPTIAAVDRDPDDRRWFVRMKGEQKDTFTIWLTLRQRTLHYETYVMPAPEENHEQFYEHLLRRNLKLYGAALRHRRGGRGVPRRAVPQRSRGRRRARPDPGLALRLGRAVLPPRAPHRVRIPLQGLIFQGDVRVDKPIRATLHPWRTSLPSWRSLRRWWQS